MIVKDDALLDEFRKRGRCEICHEWRHRLFPHHFHGRGMGGGSQMDVRENLLALCWKCHEDCHWARVERKEQLRLIARREKMTPEQVMDRIYELLGRRQ